MAPPTDPRPRTAPLEQRSIVWPTRCWFACPAIDPPPKCAFVEVFEERRSVREMSPLSLHEIVNTIAYATVPRFKRYGDSAHRTARPALSAGALHPLTVAIIIGKRNPRAFRYDPTNHRLEMLASDRSGLSEIRRDAETVLPEADGALLVFLADAWRTKRLYSDAESLIWRDAGALLQTIALAATAFGQSFCPIGPLGGALVRALDGELQLTATGAALLGRRRS